ncbi:DNA primase [Capillimicrobium parvum]|uniref:DNA primase n=1 Tax=Capillimicrobium parvum TaxID=2884022 RepID=A0A9E6XYQ6_9ACTN|nr:DNA primase [Capillimicrobium parvum]UGS37082.1 DNA primase [Capillimicrobium parvum]
MPRYRDDAKEKVRDAVDFVSLVSAKTELRRTSGSGFMGLCPFHDERTPSFSVDAAKKVFHCFGCGEQGDLFSFIELTEGVDFVGALELLADRHGIELEVEDEDPAAAERRRARDRLLELLDRTATFYERMLWEGREAVRARKYLADRGLSEATLREFRVGYAPSRWDTVFLQSQKAGFQARELYDAGLATRGRDGGRLHDYFRGRVMFPLCDVRGRVLGFGARALSPEQRPKYLNTSEKRGLFHKGSIVYGAHLARASAAKAGVVIVCEGYTDVVALRQAGVANAVASMGTALTEEQIVELGRMAPTVQLALDADDAGQDAMLRAARVAAGRRLELRVVPLPAGRDPADVVLTDGADAMRSLVARSVPFVRFRVERTLALGDLTSAEGKDRAIEALRPAFATLGASVLQEELVAMVADRLDISAELARRLLYARSGGDGESRPVAAPAGRGVNGGDGDGDPGPEEPRGGLGAGAGRSPRGVDRRTATERWFLALCIALPDTGGAHLADIDPEKHFTDALNRRAALWLRDHLASPLDDLPPDDDELAALIRELVARGGAQTVTAATLDVERVQLELAVVERQIARAETGQREELARRRIVLRAELDAAMERSLA